MATTWPKTRRGQTDPHKLEAFTSRMIATSSPTPAQSSLPSTPTSSASGSALKRVTSWGALKSAFSRSGNSSFSSSGKLVIQIQYCSGCGTFRAIVERVPQHSIGKSVGHFRSPISPRHTGYDKQYEDLKAYLERKVGDRVEVVAKKDKKITGNFEVSALRTGDILHSKKVAGQGRAESKEERRAILQQIEIMLNEAEE
jgi:hypothetical protein